MALEQDPPRDLVEFYHEIEMSLRQEGTEADEEEVNALEGGGSLGADLARIKENGR